MNRTPLTLIVSLCLGVAACGPDSSNNGTNNGTGVSNNGVSNNGVSNNGVSNNGVSNNGTTTSNNGTAASNNGTTQSELIGFATTADFASSTSAWMSVSHDTDGYHAGDPVSFGAGDVGLSVGDGFVYVVDRMGGVVQVLRPDTPGYDVGRLQLEGNITNPHSVADANGKVYVSLYDAGSLAVASSFEGAWNELTRIDLAEFDGDGNPEPSAMLADGGYILVILQTLENFAGVANSQLVVVDAQSDEIVEVDGNRSLDLGLKNCAGGFVTLPTGGFAVGCIGDYAVNDGGIVRIDSSAPGTYSVGPVVVTEEDLGGDVLDFAMTSAEAGIATLSLADFSSVAVLFDAGTVTDFTASSDPGYAGLDVSPTAWAIGDRTATAIIFTDATGVTVQSVDLPQSPAGFRFAR